MRAATLGLFYIVKYMELAFLFVWSGLLLSSSLWFIDRLREQAVIENKDVICICMICGTLVLVLFNLLYNNLLINLRFAAKMKCVTFGMCLFDGINLCQCYCFLNKPCRDRCFTPWTIVKWIIKAGLIGFTIFLVT